MPAARAPDLAPIEAALAALSDALTDARVPWMVIGGIAVIAHGVQRMTSDIDAVIQGDAMPVRSLLAVLRRHDIRPRIDDAEAFAAANMVMLVRHLPTEVDLDLSLGWTGFERDALAARVRVRYGKVTAPMARVEELLVFKAVAGRARDIDDAVTLLTLYPSVDRDEARRRVAELAAVAEAPELTRGFEVIVAAVPARARPARPEAPRGPRKTKSQAPRRAPRTATSPGKRPAKKRTSR